MVSLQKNRKQVYTRSKRKTEEIEHFSVERENCWQTTVRKLKDGIAFFAEHSEHFMQRRESRRQEHTSGTGGTA